MSERDDNIEISRGPAEGIRITMASQDKVENFQYELEEILEKLGHPEALITDLSSLGDFLTGDDGKDHACLVRISSELAIDLGGPDELLVDVAKRVRALRKN